MKVSRIWTWLVTTLFESFVAFSLLLIFLGFVAAYVVFSAIDAVLSPRKKK